MDTQAQLQRAVRERLQTFEKAWGPQALKAKQRELCESPTPEMTRAFNAFVVTSFPNQVSEDFVATDAITHEPLLNALKDFFLVKSGQARSLSAQSGTAEDWNGKAFAEFPLPSREVLEATKGLASEALQKLAALSESELTETERALKGRLELKLTSLATGSLAGSGLGGDDLLTPYGRASWGYDLNNAWGDVYKDRPTDFLKDATAYWLASDLERVNAGSVTATVNDVLPLNVNPDAIKEVLGDPATSVEAKAITLLSGWFAQRLEAHPDAGKKGWQLEDAERQTMWKSYQADMLVSPENQLSVPEYGRALDALTARRTVAYQDAAVAALEAVFPAGSPLLPDEARAKVIDGIRAEPTFGRLKALIPELLDAVTGKPEAGALFRSELEGVGGLGGYDTGAPVKPEDEAKLQAMWQDVKAFVARHYAGGKFDLAALLPKEIKASTTVQTSSNRFGEIIINLEQPANTAGLYTMMLHEAKHSLDYATGLNTQVEGSAWEGAATLVQDLVPALLQETFEGDPKKAALARFSLIDIDVRYGARSEATQAAFAASPSEDGVQLARDVAAKWGLTPELADALVYRAFNGLQYVQYLGGMAMYGELMRYLQEAVGEGARTLDPFVLQMHGIGTAAKDPATVQHLKDALA